MTETATAELKCMEVQGGFQAINRQYTTAGMKIWLYSRPQATDKTGGDVYYLSSCASGRISRILLADISGHGVEITPLSKSLRTLMRKNINSVSSAKLAAQLNRDFEAADDRGSFATSLISTYFCPTKTLTLNTAGHPTPFLRRAGSDVWESLADVPNKGIKGLRNLPLGVNELTGYDSREIKMQDGDLLLSFTDGLLEATDQSGQVLGMDRLLELVNTVDATDPDRFIDQLLKKVKSTTGDELNHDDLTVMLCQIQPGKITLAANLLAPFKLIRSLFVRDA